MARRAVATGSLASGPGSAPAEPRVAGARLEPVRKVRRELKSPSGRVVIVEVPVYPPFRLKTDAEREPASG